MRPTTLKPNHKPQTRLPHTNDTAITTTTTIAYTYNYYDGLLVM